MVITRYAIRFRTAVFVLMANLLVVGLISFQLMPREMTPDIEIPVVVVQVPYPGASPEDIEQLILTPVERELKDLKNVNKMSGAAYEGAAVVTIEFSPEANIDESLQMVRDRVSRVRPKLPADIQDPTTQEVSFSDFPILIVNVSGSYSPERLKRFAKDLQEDIENVPGVLQARLAGGLEEHFRISVDPEAAAARGVELGAIVRAIQSENINLPGGLLELAHTSYLLRTPADFRGEQQLRQVIVKAPDGKAIRITEVAKIERAFVKPTSYARINQQTCVSLQITKRTGANIIGVVDGVKALVDSYAARAPQGTELKLLQDQSVEIRKMVDDLVNNIFTSLLLVVAVIFFFMGARNAALVSLAVPLSMLLTFVTLDAMGVTLNMVTLFSLILALGMLVDNAIVVIENIYRHLGERVQADESSDNFRRARLVAAFTGTREVAWPVIASTATTVAAFAPLLFWPGIMGKFMGYLPMVVIITLLSSLLVALVMNPVTAAVFMKRPSGDKAPEATSEQWEQAFSGRIYRVYSRVLRFAIDHKRKRLGPPLLIAGLSGLCLVASMMAYGASGLGVEFFPETTPKRATVSVVAPNGTHLDGSDRIVRQVEAAMAKLHNIRDFVATPGAAAQEFGAGGGGAANAHQSGVSVDFVDEDERIESSLLTIDRMRQAFASIAGARIEVKKEDMGPPSGAPISVRLRGDKYAVLGSLSERVLQILRSMESEGVADPKSNYVTGRPELQVVVDRQAAKEVGASTSAVAMAIRNAFNGNESSVIRDGADEYDIVVRYQQDRRRAPSDLSTVRVPGKDGILVPLDQLTRVVRTSGSGTIRHLDTDRVVTIDADVSPGANANKLRTALSDRLDAELTLPGGYSWDFGGENAEQEKAAAFLSKALMIGLFAILIILVTQFNSLLKPAIIVSSVVLSLIGVFAGLVLTQNPFGVVMTGLGVISLAGVVVNNAIVLIDYIEQLQRSGLALREAVLRAGMTRLRPVLLTALTTILGLVPMAMGWSLNFLEMRFESAGSSGEFWGGMAIAVIFGLLFATVLTLVVVPALYVILTQTGSSLKRATFGSDLELDLEKELASLPKIAARALLGLCCLASLTLSCPAAAQTLALPSPASARKSHDLNWCLTHLTDKGPQLLSAKERMKIAALIVDRAWTALHPYVSASGTYSLNDPVIAIQFANPQQLQQQTKDTLSAHISTLESVRTQMVDNGQNTTSLDEAIDAQKKARDGAVLPNIPAVEVNRRHGLSAQLQVQMSLYDARTFDGLEMAKTTASVARDEFKLTAIALKHAVARAYLGALLQGQSLQMLRRRLKTAQRDLKATNARMQAGVGTELVKRSAQLRVIESRRAVVQAELAYRSAVAALGLMIGATVDFDVEDLPSFREPRPVSQRRELSLLARQLKLTEMRVSETRKRWLPRLSLVGQSQWSNAQGFGGQNITSVLMLTVTQQLWDGGNSSIDRREMLGAHRQLTLQRQQTKAQLNAEVLGAKQRLKTARADFVAAAEALEVARMALIAARKGLDAGSNTELDLLTQQDRMADVEMAHVRAGLMVQSATLQLRQALGLAPLQD